MNVFSKDLIFVPIHCSGNHWTLALINLRQKRFEFYDSLRGSEALIFVHLRRWLQDEFYDKRKQVLDTSLWPNIIWSKNETPEQYNGSDCGIFMCYTARFLACDAVLNFSQSVMDYLRQRMTFEIATAKLLPL